jgi:hypothetical protein
LTSYSIGLSGGSALAATALAQGSVAAAIILVVAILLACSIITKANWVRLF